jgi:nucleotide-binding universal stress UspA family protein
MEKILIPVDGSAASQRAIEFVISKMGRSAEDHVYLINVQEPAPAPVLAQAGLSNEAWHAVHQSTGRQVMESAEKALAAARLHYTSSVAVGEVARAIADRAHELGCTQVVMGTRGMSLLGNLVLGSVATRVIHLVACPVTLVK